MYLNDKILTGLMQYCYNCGEKVEKSWNNCPQCSSNLTTMHYKIGSQTKDTIPSMITLPENYESSGEEIVEVDEPSKTWDYQPDEPMSLYKKFEYFQVKIGFWMIDNKIKAGLILLVLIGSIIAFNTQDEDEGIIVEYTVTNYNCQNVEVQYIDSNENVQIIKNLAEGETFEIEVAGFELNDLVGVSGTNRGTGYCTIIVNMYSWLWVDMQNHDTAGEGESIGVANTL